MAERNLLCIEPDSDTVAEIRNALSPYGFGVESIANGEEAIEWGRSHPTSLIILSVEPRKVGYAICNKIKRSPSLREIPLILISSEETLATFEQHKKLKAHADEYLLKPLDIEELLAKVNNLVPLGEKMDVDEIHEADSGDIILGDEERAAATARAAHHASDEGEDVPTAVAASAQDLEGQAAEAPSDTAQQTVLEPPESPELSPFQGETFDSETQAAFAALEAGANEAVGEARARGRRHGRPAVAVERRGPAAVAGLGGAAQDHRHPRRSRRLPAEHAGRTTTASSRPTTTRTTITRSPRRSCR